MIVHLESEAIQWAIEISRAALPSTQYIAAHYPNTLKSHVVGKLGELAVEKWAVPLFTVDSVFRDPSRLNECDLVVNDLRIEVKTWSASSWEDLGRCVNPKQLVKHAVRVDLFLWTHLMEDIDPEDPPDLISINLAGTSTVGDVQAAPLWIHRTLASHQVDQDDVRPLSMIG